LAPRSWCDCSCDRCEASCDWSSPSERSSRESRHDITYKPAAHASVREPVAG
jgi:hypothetical protein